jgi:ankyrin repeat protein
MPKGSASERLFAAAENGDLEALKRGIGAADVNQSGHGGSTALLVASFNGHASAVKMLLHEGAEIDQVDEDGDTALIVASDKGFSNVVDYLLSSDADLTMVNSSGWTALLRAAHQGHFNVVGTLLEAGCDPSITSPCGLNCLMFACKAAQYKAVASLIKIADTHFSSKSLCMARNAAGATCLHLLLRAKVTPLNEVGSEDDEDGGDESVEDFNQLDALQILLEVADDTDQVVAMSDKNGCTPLMCAAGRGDLDALQLLLDSGADIDSTDDEGDSALMYSCVDGHEDAVALLVEYGADVNLQNFRGYDPVERAMDMGHADVVRSLGVTERSNETEPALISGSNGDDKKHTVRVRFQ